ncbi:hypothetical protein HMPREF9120_02216 [Neisseria sp. oral taxon 020 str. F0370]|nr:hypothetical protein HMPREF9120_02216 [Neisseria sp. oral taxon 020 str. F0370]
MVSDGLILFRRCVGCVAPQRTRFPMFRQISSEGFCPIRKPRASPAGDTPYIRHERPSENQIRISDGLFV